MRQPCFMISFLIFAQTMGKPIGVREEKSMNMNPKQYNAYVKKLGPKSPIVKDCLNAFWIAGLICVLGQLIQNGYAGAGLDKEAAGTATSMSLVLLSVLLTGFSLYDDLAKVAGAGTLVPITGFANSIAAPAIEFKSEGIVTGTCVKLFSIAGPVLVFGTTASVVYGLLYWVYTLLW